MTDYRRSFAVLLTATVFSTAGSFIAAALWDGADLLQYYCYSALFVTILSLYLPAERFIAGRNERFGRLKPGFGQLLICVSLGFALFLLSSGINALMALALEPLGVTFSGTELPDMTGWRIIGVIAVVAFVPAFCEETLFRGALLNAWRPLGRNRAIALCALCFALMHANPPALPSIFIMSWVLGAVAYDTRSVYCSMLIHFTVNTVVCAVGAAAAGTGAVEAVSSVSETLMYALMYVLFGAALCALGLRRIKRLSADVEQPVPEHIDGESKKRARVLLCAALVILILLNVWGMTFLCG